MTTRQRVQALIREVAELPDEAQAEVVQVLLEQRSQHLGIYALDDDEREALARSGEDVAHGRFASDHEIEHVYSQHSA